MTEQTLSNATETFSHPIAEKFFENYDSMRKQYEETGVVPSDIIRNIIGDPPIIPDSPDVDVRLDAYEKLAEYSRLYQNIEAKVKNA